MLDIAFIVSFSDSVWITMGWDTQFITRTWNKFLFISFTFSFLRFWLCRYHFVWRDDVNHSFAIGLNSHTVPTGWNGDFVSNEMAFYLQLVHVGAGIHHRGWVRISLEDENSNIQVTHHNGLQRRHNQFQLLFPLQGRRTDTSVL